MTETDTGLPNTHTPEQPQQTVPVDKDESLIQEQEEVANTFILTEENFLEEDLVESEGTTSKCNEEMIISYRLYPYEETSETHTNFLCPYVRNDCCSLSAQKLIQILWGRISEPRLKRTLTRHLHHIEKIIEYMKSLLNLYKNNFLPLNEKYSAECLTSMDDMTQFLKDDLSTQLDEMYERIKMKFNTLYKFKKQFYCDICDQSNQDYYNIFDKQIVFSQQFCNYLQVDFKDIAWFLNYSIIKYFKTFRNYVLCYREKNFLMANNLYKFIYDREALNDISQCRESADCFNFCNRYSFTKMPNTFIGDITHLEEIHDFLRKNKADNRGFFRKDELTNEEKLEVSKIQDAEGVDYMQPTEEETRENDLDSSVWDFYKNTFEMHKKRLIKKKMNKIKNQVDKEFDERLLHQNFLTTNDAKIDLDDFHIKLAPEGLNPYDYLDKQDLYYTNANLTFYQSEVSNVVSELMDLNETNIMNKLVNMTKLISDDDKNMKNIEKYIESKLFSSDQESSYFLIENPYINTSDKLSKSSVMILASCLLFLTFQFN